MSSTTRRIPVSDDLSFLSDPHGRIDESVHSLFSTFRAIAGEMCQRGADAAQISDFLAILLLQNQADAEVRRLNRAVSLLLRATWLEQVGQLSMAQIARDTSKHVLRRMSDEV